MQITNAKKPVENNLLDFILRKYNRLDSSVQDIRIFFVFSVGFSGALRCDEIIHITRENIVLSNGLFLYLYDKRKNDQHKTDHIIYLPKSDTEVLCPVEITKKLLAKIYKEPNQPLVCRLTSRGMHQL